MKTVRKNSNAYRIYQRFLGEGMFYTSDVVGFLSIRRWNVSRKMAYTAAIKFLKALQQEKMVVLIASGPHEGLHGACWEIAGNRN